MAVSSVGIGSGLDVESIVTQMVALEKQPIKTLEAKSGIISSKISTYGEIKSLTDDLNAAVRDLTLDRTWSSVKIASSNSAIGNATMTGAAAAGSYNLTVEALAQAQTSVTSKLAKGATMDEAGIMAFTVGGTTHRVEVGAADTMDSLVAKINAHSDVSKAVVASVVTDADGNQQLMLRARETGTKGAFSVSVTTVPALDGSGQLESFGAMPAHSSHLSKLVTQHAQQTYTESWSRGATAGAAGSLTFNFESHSAINVEVKATDTLVDIAAKINANAQLATHGMSASVVSDGAGNERLVVNSQGPTFGLNGAGSANLDNLKAATGSSTSISPVVGGQPAQDAKIRLNGVEMVGSSNTFADTLPGLSISISSVGDSLLSITEDTEAIKASIQKFVDAYNAVNDLLVKATSGTRTADGAVDEAALNAGKGLLQGDSSTVSLQNALRMLTQGVASQATGAFTRLADAGIQMLQGGKLSVDATKLATATGNMDALKSMFAAKADALGNGGGIAVNFKSFTDELLAYTGALNSKTDSLEAQLKTNKAEVTKVETRAETVEARLRKQYTALDVKMASLGSLSSYVEQMVASWNKSKD